MILTALILAAVPLLALWWAHRGQRHETSREFDPNWGGSYPSRASHERFAMNKQYAESGLPPEPRHPYFDYLHNEAGRG